MRWKISILILASFLCSCSDSGMAPESRDFNLQFSYGVGARNVLNTFENTYTKDLILDGTATIPFILTPSELQRIKLKMLEMDFFGYPDTFAVTATGRAEMISPYSMYNFEVHYNASLKRIHWKDCIISEDSAAMKLREMSMLIKNIIVSHPEYTRLPAARGGYL
jgi:hypothetical protein